MRSFAKTFFAVMVLGALVAGCGSSGGGGGSSVVVDKTPPSVVYTTPVNDESGVGTNTKITVTFSEELNRDTVTKDAFQLATATGTPVDINTVTYDEANKIATITPASLQDGEKYTVTVTKDVLKDLAGNIMTDSYIWTFKMDAAANAIAPVLTSKAPAEGAINVGINTVIAMSFSKPMDIATFTLQTFTLKPTAMPVPVTGKFAIIGQVVVFTPDIPLSPNNTEYTATLTGVKDLTDQSLAAPVTWTFTTGASTDGDPPRVDSTTPANGDTDVPLDSPISVKFNEPVYPFLYGDIEGKPTKVEIDYNTNTVTMTPTVPLVPGKNYPAGIRTKDLSGNLMNLWHIWSFTTAD